MSIIRCPAQWLHAGGRWRLQLVHSAYSLQRKFKWALIDPLSQLQRCGDTKQVHVVTCPQRCASAPWNLSTSCSFWLPSQYHVCSLIIASNMLRCSRRRSSLMQIECLKSCTFWKYLHPIIAIYFARLACHTTHCTAISPHTSCNLSAPPNCLHYRSLRASGVNTLLCIAPR